MDTSKLISLKGQRSRCSTALSAASLLLLLSKPTLLSAHASDQGFVLLLPTQIYISAGVLAVVLTIVALGLFPAHSTRKLFSSYRLASAGDDQPIQILTSLLSLALLAGLIVLGIIGSRDPLQNPLPLYIWTVWWMGLVALQGTLGNVWYWLNPWSGVYRLLMRLRSTPNESNMSIAAAQNDTASWPAIAALMLLVSFSLTDLAPDDPFRLAVITAAYWLYTLAAMLLVGEQTWLRRGEFVTQLMQSYARLAPLSRLGKELRIGWPAWYARAYPMQSISGALFILLLLGCGSFDGLNETFWWLSLIGINPLEYPGRSAVVLPTTLGIIATNLILIAAFGLCVWLGLRLAGRQATNPDFIKTFTRLSVSVLPIAFAYHLAHFMTAFLVNIQYVVAATSDPLARGDDWLGIGQFYVTSGFLNDYHSVEIIWLSQATVVVIGHVLSIMLAHAIAVDLFKNHRRAVLSQLPLATFMVVYTFLGLWLLAAPKGA